MTYGLKTTVPLKDRVIALRGYLENYYREHGKNLLYHGWHHIVFVTDKAVALAKEMNVNSDMIEAAALTHDLNYLVDPYSRAEAGHDLREKILMEHGYTPEEIDRIHQIVECGDLRSRDEGIVQESKILSDADSLFKCLPVSPLLFTDKYLQQTGIGIRQMAESINRNFAPMIDEGLFFYTDIYRERYSEWARQNGRNWKLVLDCLNDPSTIRMLEIAGVKV